MIWANLFLVKHPLLLLLMAASSVWVEIIPSGLMIILSRNSSPTSKSSEAPSFRMVSLSAASNLDYSLTLVLRYGHSVIDFLRPPEIVISWKTGRTVFDGFLFRAGGLFSPSQQILSQIFLLLGKGCEFSPMVKNFLRDFWGNRVVSAGLLLNHKEDIFYVRQLARVLAIFVLK